MNSMNLSCRRCGFDIESERLNQEVVVCNHCGHSSDEPMLKEQKSIQSKYKKLVMTMGFLIVASYIQLMEWDQHFFSIIPLKTRELLGMASAQDLRTIADICSQRLNHGCTINALQKLAQVDSQAADVMFELGEILRKTGDINGAQRAYSAHLDRGGNIPGAAYELARIFDVRHDIEKSIAYFKKALAMKPEVIQVTVIQAYVHMLIRAGRLNEASAVIADVRKLKGATAKYFMVNEMNQIRKAQGKAPESKG